MAKILTIDDDEAIRALFNLYLQRLGHEVLEAGDGQAGIAACRAARPDLVLCDLRMPVTDGLDVLDTLVREDPDLPVIMVSGQGALGDAIGALKLGAWDYVTKPIADLGELAHAVDRALERARLIHDNRRYREQLEAANEELRRSLAELEDDERAAREIQFRLLPEDGKRYGADGAYRFSRRLYPSSILSGDFVDYFGIDAEHVGFYIADVAGHGVPSALVTVLLKGYMNRYLELYREIGDEAILDPAEVLARLNTEMLAGGHGKHVSMFYGVVDLAAGRLCYGSGGQFPFPILADGATRYIGRKSTPVGLFGFSEYRSETVDLPERFALALVSDGILETLGGSDLGEKKASLLAKVASPECDIDALVGALGLGAGVAAPDDITLLLLRREG